MCKISCSSSLQKDNKVFFNISTYSLGYFCLPDTQKTNTGGVAIPTRYTAKRKGKETTQRAKKRRDWRQRRRKQRLRLLVLNRITLVYISEEGRGKGQKKGKQHIKNPFSSFTARDQKGEKREKDNSRYVFYF